MQGSSRASLAAAREQLDTVAGAAAMQLADELFAVAGLLDTSAALRRGLTDPGRDGDLRSSVLKQLLTGQISAGALAYCSDVVAARWSQPRDLPDAFELLAIDAVVIAAEQGDELDSLEDELFRFERTVSGNRQLREGLADRRGSAAAKAALVSALLDGKATSATIRLARQAVLAPRGRRLDQSMDLYVAEAAARREQAVAHATVATPLTKAQQERLTAALAVKFARPVQLNVEIDPDLVGGIRIEIGDEVVDGSILGRLDEARRRLAG